MSRSRRRSRVAAGLMVMAAIGVPCLSPPAASAGPVSPVLTYLPAGFVHSNKTDAQVTGYLADLDSFGINQALVELAGFAPAGALGLSVTDKAMVRRWVAQASKYDQAHARTIDITAVLNGRVGKDLDLDNPATRAAMVVGIISIVDLGVTGVQLDLEPYPTTPGYVALLTQVDGALAAQGLAIRLSVVAPADTARWSPTYLQAVSGRVDQIDPLYYDSGIKTVPAYEAWVSASLAYYSTKTSASARIVPVLPSYKKNRWHNPAVENISTATMAVSHSIDGGNRVDGVGIWWWWGFFYGENGKYNPMQDQLAWQTTTRLLFGA